MLSRREFLETLGCTAVSAGIGLSAGCTDKKEAATRWVKTVCRICGANCGMDVGVKEGKIVKIRGTLDHPISRGYLCSKGLAAEELVYAPDRLKYPLKKEANTYKRISWDEAISTIAEKLQNGRTMYGAQSLVVYTGKALVGQETRTHIKRFCTLYGTPNLSSAGSLCHVAGVIGETLTYGCSASPDIENTRCIIVWGSNPFISSPLRANTILGAKERGAKLAVIDPRFTHTAKRADLYLQIRPGSDCALALGILHVMINEHLYDKDFVKYWTTGFEDLLKVVMGYPPEKVEKLTGVPSMRIRELARMYGKTKPACIVRGNALLVQRNGVQTIRAICILQAITGNLDIPGGIVFGGPTRGLNITLEERLPIRPIGGRDYPLWFETRPEAQANLLPGAILTGRPYPIKNMVIIGGNPVLTSPNTRKWRNALKGLEFLVVMDLFMTETTKLAHIVLPATTFLETEEAAALQAIPAQWESWPDRKFIFQLARKMDMGEHFPWKEIAEAAKKSHPPQATTANHRKKGFPTPSGKVEIYSHKLKELGYDPVPVHHEPEESPLSRPELAKEYPLVLISGARLFAYLHSQFRNLPSLRRLIPHPQIEIHEQTAKRLDIGDGEEVIVESARGSIKIRTKVTGDIHPQTVSISHGWNEANVNLLTSDDGLDPISGFPPFNGLLCNVRKP